jgi:hypothetical protein
MDPNYHGLLIFRDTHTFPVSQSKLEAALFGATFSFKLTVVKISLNLCTPAEAAACTANLVYPLVSLTNNQL